MASAKQADTSPGQKFGLPDGVSPFLQLLKADVARAYPELTTEEKSFVVTLGYMEYCEEKKWITRENAAMSLDPLNDKNVKFVYNRYISDQKRADFAALGFGRMQGFRDTFGRSHITETARREMENISKKAAAELAVMRVDLRPKGLDKFKEHFATILIVAIVAIAAPFLVFLLGKVPGSTKLCEVGAGIIEASGHDRSQVNCSAKPASP